MTNLLIGGKELSRSIPEHEFYEEYGPDFVLPIRPGNKKNCNDEDYLEKVLKIATDSLLQLNVEDVNLEK